MKVFVSWSQDRGRLLAEALWSWLPLVIQRIEPFVSSEDIVPGTRWNTELAQQLEKTSFGIICVTRETVRSPWLLFEAGALAKTIASTFVCPVLLDIGVRQLGQPLDQFDAVQGDKEGIRKLVKSINRAFPSDQALGDDHLRLTFEKFWPDLDARLQQIPKAPPWTGLPVIGPDSIGLLEVFRNRQDALERFNEHLYQEMKKPESSKPFVYFTGTSLRGFMVPTGKSFDGRKIIQSLAQSHCNIRILMAQPDVADKRYMQEKRSPGQIKNEVKADVKELFGLGIKPEWLRYYSGSPTVFGIVTSEMILLNPYPAEDESHRCFSLIARRTNDRQDIYHQYFNAHFNGPWQNAKPNNLKDKNNNNHPKDKVTIQTKKLKQTRNRLLKADR